MLSRGSSFSTGTGPLLPRQMSSSSSNDNSESSSVSRPHSVSAGAQKPGDGMQRQGSISVTGNGVLRQGSQGSLFEQIASQAKDLVRETTRQSSQDGLLAQMDKVYIVVCPLRKY